MIHKGLVGKVFARERERNLKRKERENTRLRGKEKYLKRKERENHRLRGKERKM